MAIAEAGVEKPHAVFFPFPVQGHIKPTLQLAKLLHRVHGFQVTFVHTDHNRRRLLRSRGPGALAGVPGFRFVAIPDGLPPSESEDASQDMGALLGAMETLGPCFRKLVSDLPPVSCVISDVWQVLYVAKEMGLPCTVTLWTTSACGFMALQQCQTLVDMGIVPLKGKGLKIRSALIPISDLLLLNSIWNYFSSPTELGSLILDNTVLDWVPGMPKDIRLRDFPSFVRTVDPDDPLLKVFLRSMAYHRTTPSAVILHTFDELEREVIAAMSSMLPPIYAVGPFPLLLAQVSDGVVDTIGSTLSEEIHACLEWLDGKAAELRGVRELWEHNNADEATTGRVRVGLG